MFFSGTGNRSCIFLTSVESCTCPVLIILNFTSVEATHLTRGKVLHVHSDVGFSSQLIRAGGDKSPRLLQSQREQECISIIHIQTEDKSWMLVGVSGFLSSATCQDTMTLMLEKNISGLN